jgi:hypothetical protein
MPIPSPSDSYQGTNKGVIIAPIFVPELYIPVAKALSFFGNHSAIVLFAAGKLPASVKPRAARHIPKVKALCARACPIAAKLQPNNA